MSVLDARRRKRSTRAAGVVPGPLVDRRSLLRAGGLGALGLGLGCRSTPNAPSGPATAPASSTAPAVGGAAGAGASFRSDSFLDDPGRGLARVQVAPEREIRTVVGLRPFRRSGFRVEAERLDELLVVYNYGHGGAGVTLSWGTSHLAMELALQGDAGGSRSCAVLGCGAVGLATARLMQRRGWRVTIYARELPPDTTSNIAGAQWQPHAVSDPGQTGSEYEFSFVRAARLAHRYFQTMLGSYYGVRCVDNYIVSTTPMPAPWFPAGTDVLLSVGARTKQSGASVRCALRARVHHDAYRASDLPGRPRTRFPAAWRARRCARDA